MGFWKNRSRVSGSRVIGIKLTCTDAWIGLALCKALQSFRWVQTLGALVNESAEERLRCLWQVRRFGMLQVDPRWSRRRAGDCVHASNAFATRRFDC